MNNYSSTTISNYRIKRIFSQLILSNAFRRRAYIEQQNQQQNYNNKPTRRDIITSLYLNLTTSDKRLLKKQQDSCAICCIDYKTHFKNKYKVIKLYKCKHIFCKCCITMWLKNHNTCPYCRMEYTELEYIKSQEDYNEYNGMIYLENQQRQSQDDDISIREYLD